MSEFDLPGLYQFLSSTPEQGLRKMFVDGKPMTEVHFNLLMKYVRACNEHEFCEHVEKGDWPKVKFSANEIKIRETFWTECFKTFSSRGILNPADKKIAA